MVDDPESPISGLGQIDAVGNRIVAGGEYFTRATPSTEARADLSEVRGARPWLHNPCRGRVHRPCARAASDTPQVAVFDTAFHQTMPPKAYMYPLPMRYYDEYSIRRYGAHGTSHRYAAQQAANLLGRPCATWASSRATLATAAPSPR